MCKLNDGQSSPVVMISSDFRAACGLGQESCNCLCHMGGITLTPQLEFEQVKNPYVQALSPSGHFTSKLHTWRILKR